MRVKADMNTFQKINLIAFILLLFPIFCVICAKCEAPDNNEVTVGENTHQIERVTEVAETTSVVEVEETTDMIIEDTEVNTEEYIEEDTATIAGTVEYFTEKDVIALAKVLYNECRGVPSDMEKACVAWTVCNRVDAGYGDTVYDVLIAPNQFAYRKNTPVTEELYTLALDVLTRWNDEKNEVTDVGRVLPQEYMWFRGDGKHNYFRNAFSGSYDIWDYSLDNPYDD